MKKLKQLSLMSAYLASIDVKIKKHEKIKKGSYDKKFLRGRSR